MSFGPENSASNIAVEQDASPQSKTAHAPIFTLSVDDVPKESSSTSKLTGHFTVSIHA